MEREKRRISLLRFGELPEMPYSCIREVPRCCSTTCNWRDSPAPNTIRLYTSCCAHTFCESKSAAEELAGLAEMLVLLQGFLEFLWAEGR